MKGNSKNKCEEPRLPPPLLAVIPTGQDCGGDEEQENTAG